MNNMLTCKGMLKRWRVKYDSFLNRHTFQEKIYLDLDELALAIEVVIGGYESGIIFIRHIREGDDFFYEYLELYQDVLKIYSEEFKTIEKDLKF